MSRVIIFIVMSVLTGCSIKQISQGVYEGAQARNQMLTPPAERLEKEAYPAYGDYAHQRTGILRRDNGGTPDVP